jgi:hypothetical protein
VNEIWKDIVVFEGKYQISNLGRVKSLSRKVWGGKVYYTIPERILKYGDDTHGYYRVVLTNNNVKRDVKVHRLVAETFIHNPESKPCVNHLNGIPHDNSIDNLEWCTHRENNMHALETGLRKTKPIGMYDLTINFICEFSSIAEAVRYLRTNGYPKAANSNIIKNCKGEREKAYNHKWRMIENV